MHFKKEIFDKHMDKKDFQQHMHVWTWDCHANNGISAWKHKMFTRIFSYPVLYWNVSEWCFNFWTFCSTRWFGTKLFWNPDGNIKYTLRHSFLHPLRNAFSNFSLKFLNPIFFFQFEFSFIRSEKPPHSVLEWIWIKGSYPSQWIPQGERGPPKESKSRWIEILHSGSQ